MTPTGLTRDGTWQLGVRRSAPVSVATMWSALAAAPGEFLDVPVALEPGAIAERDGIEVRIRSLTPEVVVRMSWWEQGWERDSSVQVRLFANAAGCSVSLAHEGLPDETTRARLLLAWTARVEAWVASFR